MKIKNLIKNLKSKNWADFKEFGFGNFGLGILLGTIYVQNYICSELIFNYENQFSDIQCVSHIFI